MVDLPFLAVKDNDIFYAISKIDRGALDEIFSFKAWADHLDDRFRQLVDEAFKFLRPLAPNTNIGALDRSVSEDNIHIGYVVAAALTGRGPMGIQRGLDSEDEPLMFDAWIGFPGNSAVGQFKFQPKLLAEHEELGQLSFIHPGPKHLGDHSSL